MKFYTNYVKPKYEGGEVNNEPSCTIPGDAVPIKDLLKRAFHGQDVKLMNRFGVYDDDPSFDDGMVLVRKPDVDLTDLDVITKHLKKTREIIKDRLREKKGELVTPPEEVTPDPGDDPIE